MKFSRRPPISGWFARIALAGSRRPRNRRNPNCWSSPPPRSPTCSANWRRPGRRSSGVTVKLSFAASSVLARQIEAGSNADVFISADQEWMDYLQARNLIAQGLARESRRQPAGAHRARRQQDRAQDRAGLRARRRARPAAAWPPAIPTRCRSAGTRAPRSLSLGVWDQVADRLVRADNVRSAMTFVARGEAPLGIVYATDAADRQESARCRYFPR